MNNVTINLSETELKKTLRTMVSESGMNSFAALARNLGYNETTFRSAIANDAIRLKAFLEAADTMGYEVLVRKKTD
ncbi:hypothetical protein [Halalkalibacter alkalisediminis]|uniref:HTH cro/C1-type domain-containing protein n=1 Tax=Halalkalibacter alkalisediminis TaxID=935616 RepID=A0ABV6NJ29_9BACI|nr:hypothetical protein [Halalkalibacter alkalisediminis]